MNEWNSMTLLLRNLRWVALHIYLKLCDSTEKCVYFVAGGSITFHYKN